MGDREDLRGHKFFKSKQKEYNPIAPSKTMRLRKKYERKKRKKTRDYLMLLEEIND